MSETKKDGLGLDKRARIRQKQGSDPDKAKEEATLEPPFPFVVMPFPTTFFES